MTKKRGSSTIAVALVVLVAWWLVVPISTAQAVGISTVRGNNKLFGALVIGGALADETEIFKLTTMAAAEGNPVAVSSPASSGSTAGNPAAADSSVTTGVLIPIGQVRYVIKNALPAVGGTNASGDGGNGSITYTDATTLNLGTGFAGLAALSTIASASGARFSFGGGPTTNSTVCAALATVADGLSLTPTQ